MAGARTMGLTAKTECLCVKGEMPEENLISCRVRRDRTETREVTLLGAMQGCRAGTDDADSHTRPCGQLQQCKGIRERGGFRILGFSQFFAVY